MKKRVISQFLALSLLAASATNVFAFDPTPASSAKNIPITVNGMSYETQFPVLLSNGTTYISSPDLAAITGMQINSPAGVVYFEMGDGSPLAYVPLRNRFEGLEGYVKWNNDFTIDSFLPLPVATNTEDVFISTDIFYSTEPAPMVIDGVNTNLTLTSLTPVVVSEEEANDYFKALEEKLTIDQKELEDILTDATAIVQDEDETVDTTAPNYVSSYEYSDTYKVLVNQDGYISIQLDSYTYEGGANGNSEKRIINADIVNEEILSLPDLFLDDVDSTKLLLSEIEKSMKTPSYEGEYDNVTVPTELPKDDAFYFNFDTQTLTVFYEPYELSSGARGFVYFNIPLANLENSLKDTYKYTYTSNTK